MWQIGQNFAATEIGELARQADVAYEKGKFGDAESALFRLRSAVATDSVLSVDEKNLERLMIDVRSERIRSAEARQRNNVPGMLGAFRAEVSALAQAWQQFKSFLYASERVEMESRVLRIEAIAAQAVVGGSAEALEPLRIAIAEFRGQGELASKIDKERRMRAPSVPQLRRTSPATPGRSLAPLVLGSASRGVSLRLFAGTRCEGRAAATGVANVAGAFSIGVRVPRGERTPIVAQAVSPGGTPSPCSEPVVYQHDSSPPDAPGALRLVKADSQSATVAWAFARDEISKRDRLEVEACLELAQPERKPCEPFVPAAVVRGANQMVLEGFCPRERWWVRLRSRDEAGNTSTVSAPLELTAPDGPPCPPRIRLKRTRSW